MVTVIDSTHTTPQDSASNRKRMSQPSGKAPRRRSSVTKHHKHKHHNELRDMNSKINFILSQLTLEELETAARCSYAYMKDPVPSQRNHCARGIIQRYLESKNGKVELAFEKVKKTLKFRREIGIDDLITAFDKHDCTDNDGDDDDTASMMSDDNDDGNGAMILDGNERKNRRQDTAKQLQTHLSSKKYFVQGYDKDGRATLFFIPRLVDSHDAEWTLKEAIYSIERAVACSKASDHTINAVVDFSGFSMTKHSPPLEIGKQFLTALRSHYAGQIHRIYLLDTPFSFSMLWTIFSPFVGTATRDKIKFVNGEQSKERELTQVYSLEQVPSWMIPGGQKNRDLDMEEYLHGLAFDQAFDESTRT